METNKKSDIIRIIITVAISAVLFFVWFMIEPILFPKPESIEDRGENTENGNTESSDPVNLESTDNGNDVSISNIKSDMVLNPVNVAVNDDIKIYENDTYIVYFNKKGGVIQDLRYKDYKKEGKKDGYESAVYAESIKESKDYDQIERPLRGLSLNFTKGKNVYEEPQAYYEYYNTSSGNSILLTSEFVDDKGNKVEIRKEYIFGDSGKSKYEIQLKISFTNKSDDDIVISNENDVAYYLNWGGGVGPYAKASNYDRWEPFLATKDGTSIKVIRNLNDLNKIDRNKYGIMENVNLQWIGAGNRYFLISLIPDSGKIENTVYYTDKEKFKNQTGYFGIGYSGFILKKGETKTSTLSAYVGTKKHSILSKYDNKMQETAEHGGILEFLVRFIEWILLNINSIINNFGISIIIVTILLRLVLFPLQAKSLKSMSRMKDLQPKLEEIKQQYKDNPEKQNQKTMELYRKEKINPLGGCLPLLLQLPFFIAFFNVVPYLVDLRGESFLWIKDLASPDTLVTLSFFPNQINLLPLLMTVVMVGQTILQSKLQPSTGGAAATGNQMKIFTFVMPVVFLLITYYAPSGLTLYWTISTLFGIGQQLLFNYFNDKKKAEQKVEVFDSKGKKINKNKK